MFDKWLEANKAEKFDFSGVLFPKAEDREFWESCKNCNYIKEAEKYLGYDWPLIKAFTLSPKGVSNTIKE